MPEKNDIPIFRNLDGVYYRVIRDGIHVNRCFSDLSEAEQDEIMAEYGYAIYGIKDSTVSSTVSVENVTSAHNAYQPEVPVQEGSVNG